MSDHRGFRRTPKQERSQRTVDRILDAAAELFAANGFERTTTNAVAEAAAVPIGSLYQYFDNKEALAASLADRYLANLRSLHREFHATDVTRLPLEGAVKSLLDPMIELHVSHPAYSQLMLGAQVSERLAQVVDEMDAELHGRITGFLKALNPGLSDREASRSAVVIQTSAKALLHMLETAPDEAAAQELAAESKRMIVAYARQLIEG